MAERFDLAVVAVMRDEAPYVEEWISYHTVLGVEHFFLYDNDSRDDVRHVLRRHVTHGLVTLIDFPVGGVQVAAYRHAVHCVAASSRWLAFIDLDEFIVPRLDADLPSMLRRLGDATRVVLPWRNFGMSGHRARPDGLVIERFTMAEDEPPGGVERAMFKSIARSDAIVSVGAHSQSVDPDRTVGADGARPDLDGLAMLAPSYAAAQLNHYVTKSQDEFAAKCERGEPKRNLPRRFYRVEDEVGFATPDHVIDRFVEPTRARMAELAALSPSPFRYGSRVEMRLPHPDAFVDHAGLTVSNYLHGMRITRNGAKVLPNVAAGAGRAYVAAVEDRLPGPAMWSFADSPHLPDLVRRLEAELIWSLEGGPLDIADRFEVATGAADVLRHHALVAVVRCSVPTIVRWTTDDRGGRGVETDLPEAGRHVVVVETDVHLRFARLAIIDVTAGGPLIVDELHLIRYG